MKRPWHMLRLREAGPQWLSFDGRSLAASDAPPGGRGLVVALLPDRYFFFTSSPLRRGAGTRAAAAALRLAMRHGLPPALPEQEQGSLKAPGALLGYRTHPLSLIHI